MVQPNYNTSVSSVNDGIWDQKWKELNYFFLQFLGPETSFDFITYNIRFDERIKSYNTLKVQAQLITSFIFELLTVVVVLLFSRKK